MIVKIAAAAVATVAFALLFRTPSKYYIHCGIIGGLGWALYYTLSTYTFFSPTEATFFAMLFVSLVSRFCAVWEKCPVTVFLISGLLPLVPGAGIYWTAYYLVTGQISTAKDSGFEALKITVAIVLGIVMVFELPQKLFRGRKGRRYAK
ncbi:MAG: threonine/serine exporter family protein [Butyrivibrio sp.]|nr:threonine/serine exporter family protein [Butyrivibrio sp.]